MRMRTRGVGHFAGVVADQLDGGPAEKKILEPTRPAQRK